MWVPIGRREVEALFESPVLVQLCCILRDETCRAQWTYGREHQDEIYFRGLIFEWIRPNTYLFDPVKLAARLSLTVTELRANLGELAQRHIVDSYHDGLEVTEQAVTSRVGYGLPPDELMLSTDDCRRDGCSLAAVHMKPLAGGYVRIPQAAIHVRANMLRMIVWLHLNATFRVDGRTVKHRGHWYALERGEVAASYAELERILGVHRRQISRWAEYALRDQLLLRIPKGHDAVWRIRLYPRERRA